MATKVFQHDINNVNIETGEVLSIEQRIIKKVSPDDFIQVYLEDLSGLFKLENVAEYKVLIALWKRAIFNEEHTIEGNSVVLVKAIKEQIAKETEYSLSRINTVVSTLVKKELLIQKERSIYVLNPKYFFKGYYKDRVKVVRAIIEYKIEKPAKNEADKVSNS
jgi:hypothetical protein